MIETNKERNAYEEIIGRFRLLKPIKNMEITINERKNLHKLCFEDSDVYTNGFFKLFYNGKNATDIVKDGVLAATMYTKPQFLYIGRRTVDCEFITGLCVRPEFRGAGLATRLLTKYLNASDAAFVSLHPFQRNFYEKQGFVPFSFATEDTVKATRSVLVPERVRNPQRIKLFVELAIKRNLETPFPFPRVMQYPEDKWNEIKLELDDGAEFEILCSEDKFEGYAVVKDREILCYELFDDFHLNDAAAYKGYKFYHSPLSNTVFNMARAIDLEKLFYSIPYPKKSFNNIDFIVEDSRVPKNDGAYRIAVRNGRCVAVLRGIRRCGLPVISAEQLTLLALGQPQAADGVPEEIRNNFLIYQVRDLSQY